MSRAICCDNCGAFFGVNEGASCKKTLSTADANIIAFLVDDGMDKTVIKSFDICPECMKKIFEMMPGLISLEGD